MSQKGTGAEKEKRQTRTNTNMINRNTRTQWDRAKLELRQAKKQASVLNKLEATQPESASERGSVAT